MTDSLERRARGAQEPTTLDETDLRDRAREQPTDIVRRFLATRRQAAPEVATFLTAAAIAATSALAPTNSNAQTVAGAERATVAERGFHGNASLPDPPSSGKAPVKVVGSYLARCPMHDGVLAAAMAAETTRVMLSRNRESSLLHVRMIFAK